jgi:hypothetical protein
MHDANEIILFSALGVAFAAGLIVLARWAHKKVVHFAAYALLAVSFLYVGFAMRSDAPGTWMGIELTGVAIYGSLAGLSFVASPWFAVAGLLLHPFWAISFHYLGTGAAFTAAPFALANAGFDVALGLWVAFEIWKSGAEAKTKPDAGAPKLKKGRAQ